MHVVPVNMCVQYIQDLCQSRLSTAARALAYVTHV
jgi:hypothetical protein